MIQGSGSVDPSPPLGEESAPRDLHPSLLYEQPQGSCRTGNPTRLWNAKLCRSEVKCSLFVIRFCSRLFAELLHYIAKFVQVTRFTAPAHTNEAICNAYVSTQA